MGSSPAAAGSGSKMVILVVVAAVGIAVGAFAGMSLGGSKQFEAGKMAAKEELSAKLTASGLLPPEFPTYSLTGTVGTVGSDSFTLEVQQSVRNPLAEPAPTMRTVKVSAETKIVQVSARPAEDYQKELEQFNKDYQKFITDINAGKTGVTPPAQPSPVDRKDISLSELQAGSVVSVTASEDVFRAAAFTATEVNLQPEGASAGTGSAGALIAPPPAAPIPAPAPPAAVPLPPPADIPAPAVAPAGGIPAPAPAP